MQCPYCFIKTKVTNSRSHNANQAVWRRRKCKSCNATWTTDEKYDLTTTHQVKRPNQKTAEAFRRDLLFLSIWKALQHKKTALEDATALTDTIILQILALKQPVISTDMMKETTKTALLRFDTIGAAVYSAQN